MKKANSLQSTFIVGLLLAASSCGDMQIKPAVAPSADKAVVTNEKSWIQKPIAVFNPETEKYDLQDTNGKLEQYLIKTANMNLEKDEAVYKPDMESVIISKVADFVGLELYAKNGKKTITMMLQLTENENGEVFLYTTSRN